MPTLYVTSSGVPHPIGPIVSHDGVNFSLFSANATAVELLLFEAHDSLAPFQTIALDPMANKTFHFWHVFVQGLAAGAHFAWRIDGPVDPQGGQRFDRHKVLIDPYSRGNTDALWDRAAACRAGDNIATSMRSVVIDSGDYDWEGDRPLNRPMEETIIYEMHARGFTQSSSSGVRHPGTFAGIIEKIPYLRSLGITAVELLPVFDFDEKAVLHTVNGKPLINYWGYSTVSFFAPQPWYCVSPESGSHLREFRDMVKALHRAGIEVILDVVFNHTDEGDEHGPTFAFRGIDNRTYYILAPNAPQYYMNYSGTGNTFNCNHPIAQKLIVECLRYWVREGHVDGFRFDEGSILARGEDGNPLPHPPVVWQIELDDDLANTKMIAEAWDAAGLYQIGHFPGDRWAEWNGRYRDDIRRFVRGDGGMIGAVATRLAGSSDLYQNHGQLPINSINFINCHDGFTLNDLVSYNSKHNDANGENNNDGVNDNTSWNCGSEGDTADVSIDSLRQRQIRNFATILMLSRGVPMFVAGDEVRRTQQGNNNPYCQDNEVNWFDWTLVDMNAGLLRFWQRLILFRKHHPALQSRQFYTGNGDVSWHGTQLNAPAWTDPGARQLALTIAPDVHIMLNMESGSATFQLPAGNWSVAFDTADPDNQVAVNGVTYPVQGHSIAVLSKTD